MPFNNIGGKIKGLALVMFWVGVIGSFLASLVCMMVGYTTQSFSHVEMVLAYWLLSVVIFFGGMLASWVGCFFTYGFGELIVKTTEIAENTRPDAEDGVEEADEADEDGFVTHEEVTE